MAVPKERKNGGKRTYVGNPIFNLPFASIFNFNWDQYKNNAIIMTYNYGYTYLSLFHNIRT